jgi:hypothetical protein
MSANSFPKAPPNSVPGHCRTQRLGKGKTTTAGHDCPISRSRKTKSGKVAGRHANTGLVYPLELGGPHDAALFR